VISRAGVDVKKLMTPEEKAKLYAAIGYDDEDVDPNLPKQVIRCPSCKEKVMLRNPPTASPIVVYHS